MDSKTSPGEHRFITITRHLNAAPERVFAAWTTPEDLLAWFRASPDWTTPFAESDTRSGGKVRIGFGSPDGANDFTLEGIYDEVAPPSRLAYTMGDGRPVLVTIEPSGTGTDMTLKFAMENTHSEEMQRSGWTAMVDNLEAHLGGA